jgi:plasmid stabilization system protein ParE
MPSLALAPRAIQDLERLTDFLLEVDPSAAASTAQLIADAIEILATHPLIGRSVAPSLRKLVISRGRTGYVALYTYDAQRDQVRMEGIRHQREAGVDEEA